METISRAIPWPPRGVVSRLGPSEARLRRLVDEHLRFVQCVLSNSGVPPSEIDDAVQQTFLVVSKRLESIVPAAEKAFLFRTAKHMAGHVRRSLARNQSRFQSLGHYDPPHDESPERALTRKQARQLLDGILDTLPDDTRDVFILFEFEQLSGPEIAQLIGIPTGTVASRLRRARQRFKEELSRIEAGSEVPDRIEPVRDQSHSPEPTSFARTARLVRSG